MQHSFLSHEEEARRNRNNILHYIKKHGPISRTDIWKQMDVSRASVTQVVRQLQENNLILEGDEGESTGGRKPQYIQFNGMAKKLYAFDWTSRTLCLMSMGGDILYEKKILSFDSSVTPVNFVTTLDKEINNIKKKQLCDSEEIVGFGVALPGLIDSQNTIVVNSVELGWQNVNLQELFRHHFPEKIYLERYGNLMALGEQSLEKFKESEHFQLFILDSGGIGVSTIIHNGCQHGANYMHGELGHIKIPSDVICSCGQRGCLEAVVNNMMIHSGGKLTDQILDYLAIGVSTAINIVDSSVAVLVGSYVDKMTQTQKDMLIQSIRNKLTSQQLRKIDIHFSKETKRMALTGISEYVFNCYFEIE